MEELQHSLTCRLTLRTARGMAIVRFIRLESAGLPIKRYTEVRQRVLSRSPTLYLEFRSQSFFPETSNIPTKFTNIQRIRVAALNYSLSWLSSKR